MSSEPKFEQGETYIPRNTKEKNLMRAFASLKNADEAAKLVRDMMTPAEISEFSNRLEIARLLKDGEKSYLQIAKEVGTSTTTVTRVAHWLFRGCGGYWTVLKRLFKTHEK